MFLLAKLTFVKSTTRDSFDINLEQKIAELNKKEEEKSKITLRTNKLRKNEEKQIENNIKYDKIDKKNELENIDYSLMTVKLDSK